MNFRSIKGTKDIIPGESERWHFVEATVRSVLHLHNYSELRTPIFENTALFARSIGELTDIVSKEMYTFTDRSGDSVTLRPEGTASAIRAYLQNNLGEQSPLTKLYYMGPMFRQERPQAGRLRQFHQFGAEAIGSQSPLLDVECMVIVLQILRQLGISETELSVNSVGCEKCRPPYKELLVKSLHAMRDRLSPESRKRIEQNPLRVLDSKDEGDKTLTASVPLMKDHLCEECSKHFATVQESLRALGVQFKIDGRLVRGLDYYTKTAFEITSSALGSQDALAGGGRYDLLVEELGGKPTPGVGFAAGLERILMVLSKNEQQQAPVNNPTVFLVGMDEASRAWAFRTAIELRSQGIPAETDYLERSVKAQLREANRQHAGFVIVVGGEELNSGSAKLKDMKTGEERPVALNAIASSLH